MWTRDGKGCNAKTKEKVPYYILATQREYLPHESADCRTPLKLFDILFLNLFIHKASIGRSQVTVSILDMILLTLF